MAGPNINPQLTPPMAPPAPPMASPPGSPGAGPPSADEGALLAGLAAGPQAGPAEHAKMTRPAHNMKNSKSQADNGMYGPAATSILGSNSGNAGPAGAV